MLPCDIYAAANNTCVAAHSTIRALFSAYAGNLYQIKRASDGTTKDIPVKGPGGYADSAQQEAFCMGTTCTSLRVYDQSDHGNFIEAEIPGSTVGGAQGQTAANAAAEALMVGGNKVYSLYTRPQQAYWRDGSKSVCRSARAARDLHGNERQAHQWWLLLQTMATVSSIAPTTGPKMDDVYFGNSMQWGYGAGKAVGHGTTWKTALPGLTRAQPRFASMPHTYVTATRE